MPATLLHRLLAALLCCLPAGAARAQTLALEEVAPGHYVHFGQIAERSPGNGGDIANFGFIVGSRCIAVVDTGGTLALGQALRRSIAAVSPLPVCAVILTHVHPDHVYGAGAFEGPGVTFIGHARLPRALALRGPHYDRALARDLGEAAAGSYRVSPTRLVSGTDTLDLGDRVLQLRAWGPGHTDADLTVLDAASGTLWAGDLLFVDHTPVVDGSITGYLKVLEELAGLPARQVVPGHGRATQPWPAPLAAQRHYLEAVTAQCREALRRRRTLQQALDTVGLDLGGPWVNFADYHRRNVTTAYTELEWED